MAVFKALAAAIPERIPAGGCSISHMAMFYGTQPDTGAPWGHMLFNNGGGFGASAKADGWPLSATAAAWGGLKAASIEHTELLFPFRFECWEIEPDSMGLGAHIGGPGIRCRIRPEGGEIRVIDSTDGLVNPPYGMEGGTPGAGGGTCIEPAAGPRRFLTSTCHERFTPDEVWVGVSSGGGGYGNPLERPIERVRRDVRDGLYSRPTAARVYGVVLSGDPDPVLDAERTNEAREAIAQARAGQQGQVVPTAPDASGWLADHMSDEDILHRGSVAPGGSHKASR